LKALLTRHKYDLVVVGYHVHDVKQEHCRKARDADECRKQLGEKLIQNTEKFASWAAEHKIPLLWVTSGPMNYEVIPEQYHQFQLPGDFDRERRAMAAIMQKHGFPVLDMFHVGESCRQKQKQVLSQEGGEWPSCLSDGMHGSRYLDRMRAQLLLNWKCQQMIDYT
jgi:hypothetical protein